MCFLVSVMYCLLAIYEFIPLYKNKEKNDLLINSILFIMSFVIAILLCVGIKIPSPAPYIEKIVTLLVGKQD
jgi:hypothetical protein